MHESGIRDGIVHGNFFTAHSISIIWWVTFFIAATFGYLIQIVLYKRAMSPIGFIKYCFPPASWKSPSARMDIFLYVSTKVMSRFIGLASGAAGAALAAGVAWLLNAYAPVHPMWKMDLTAIIFLSLVFFLVYDLAKYVSHYLQHFVPCLWESHKIHHSATFLNPLTTLRVHPIEILFEGLVLAVFTAAPIGAAMYWYHINMFEALLLSDTANSIGTILVLEQLRHSQFPVSFGIFDRILLSPHAHQLHHSHKVEHWDKNFGNTLSIWDWCFGTMAPPKKGEQFPYGLGKGEDQDYNTVYGVLLGPVIKIARLWRGEPSWPDPSKPLPSRRTLFERLFWRPPAQASYAQRIDGRLAVRRSLQN